VDLYSALEHLAASCSNVNDKTTIGETDVRKFSAFSADIRIMETFLESRCFTNETNFGDTTKTTAFSKFVSRLRNTSGIDDDSNDALATMAFPAKLVNAIRSSTEILVEERSRAYLSQLLASGDELQPGGGGGELLCAYSRLLELPSLSVLKAAVHIAAETFGEISAASLSFALAETTKNSSDIPSSSFLVKFASLFSNQ
jgi:hypothetical protein